MSDVRLFSENELIAGKCWIDSKFPKSELVDIALLKCKYDMPEYAEAYVREKWFIVESIKKPFQKSEIYSRTSPFSSSSSSLYTE